MISYRKILKISASVYKDLRTHVEAPKRYNEKRPCTISHSVYKLPEVKAPINTDTFLADKPLKKPSENISSGAYFPTFKVFLFNPLSLRSDEPFSFLAAMNFLEHHD